MSPRLLLVSLALFTGACGNRQHVDAEQTGSGGSAPALKRTLADGGTAPSSAELAGLDAGTHRPEAPDAGLQRPEAPASALSGVLLPPHALGQANTAFAGCLADAAPSQSSGTRFPAPTPQTRGAAGAGVTVQPLGTGALVTHALTHGCCLQARVSSELKGRTVTLTERLSGESCRCRCGSTVKAAVRLAPGAYTLRVLTQEGAGAAKLAFEGPLKVP